MIYRILIAERIDIILKLCAFSFHSFDNFRPPPPPRRRMGGFRGGGGNDLNRGV